MFMQMTCVIVDSDETNRQELATFLTRFGVEPTALFPSVEHLAPTLARPDAPILAIVNLDPHPQEMLKRIGHLPRQHPNVSFFLMSQTVEPHLLMEAMHLGIKEFIPLPINEEKFSAAMERVAQTHGMGKRGKLIHVVPTMGGCGSTTVACNVATSLATKAKTALIDLDLVRGGAAGYFDVHPRYTIADVMDSAEKADRQMLDNALCIHKNSGLAILGRPDLPEDSQRVNQAGLHRLLLILGRMFDFVVMDSMMSIDPIYQTAIAAADVNVIVMQLNVPSAKNAERYVGALRRLGIESSKMRIVVSRYVKKGTDIEPEEVERALGLKISWMVPNDFKNALAAMNFGEPVVLRAPKSDISVSLIGLAGSLSSRTSSEIAA
jgi:pilus assembly protein CpaE